jgi:hypothetical protein
MSNKDVRVTDYINAPGGEATSIMKQVRKLVHQVFPGVKEDFKWGRPVFSAKKDFAYLKAAKGYISLGFFNVETLAADVHLLEGTGKDMRHIKIRKFVDLDEALLIKWFQLLTKD